MHPFTPLFTVRNDSQARQIPPHSSQILHDARLNGLQFLDNLIPHPPVQPASLLGRVLAHQGRYPRDPAIAQILSMALLARGGGMNEGAAAHLGRARQQQFHEPEAPAGIARELGVAETRVQEVDDHAPFSPVISLGICDDVGRGRRAGGEFAGEEDLEQFRHVVPIVHVGGGSVVERGEDLALRARLLREGGEEVHARADDDEMRRSRRVVVPLAGLAELGEEQEAEQEGGDDVDGDGAFVVFGQSVRHPCDPGVLQEDVETRQLRCSLRECFDGLVARQVERPHFDHVAFPPGACFDRSLGCVSFIQAAHREDHLGRVEARAVPRRFEAETHVRAGHDDHLVREGRFRVGEPGEELSADEFPKVGHFASRCDGIS